MYTEIPVCIIISCSFKCQVRRYPHNFSRIGIESELGRFFAQGYVLTSEIDGTIQMKSYLTGNPEIKVGLNEDLAVGVRSSSSNSFGRFNFSHFLFFASDEILMLIESSSD